ncbi:MAG TPA: efflux RND transporter periplasmic adaptor subunit [Candidatus Limnocylindrales bacterium]|nr:efflux RND transporter periplasmic adaptor subunit [Candidatus Limnocylindrales bacterium]
MKRRLLFVLLILVIAGGLTGAYLYTQSGGSAPRFRTQPATRGPLTSTVAATGNLNAVVTVLVGSQVSGQIKELFADFNSQVRRNQLIARIDPSTFEAKVTQARSEVEAAEAGVLNQRAQVERSRAEVDNAQAALASAKAQTAKSMVALVDSKRDLDRKTDLFTKGLIARSDLDSAQALHDSAAAQIESSRAQEQALASGIKSAEAQLRVTEAQQKSSEATVRQKRAALQQAQVDLDYTNIRAPVDGVVVSRNVDTGQTVAASLSAPTLFTIAQDLTKMQIDTYVDEADIGRIREGQPVTFTVDSFPTETFPGRVVQIRKAPKTLQNVVTYNVVVGVENPEQKLLPGMTANIRVVVDSRPDVLKVPNMALRFRPPGEEAAPAARPAAGPSRGIGGGERRPGGGLPPIEEIRARLVKELKLTEEQQKQLEPILEENRAAFVGLARIEPSKRRPAAQRIREETRQKIRAMLTPEQQATYDQMPSGQAARGGSSGRVFVLDPEGKPKPVTIRTGITDGSYTEVLGGDVKDGQELLVSTATPGSSAPRGASQSSGGPRVRF